MASRLIVVCGTATGVGKTFVAAALATALRAAGLSVVARKPVQSYAADEGATDAERLAEATGEDPAEVGVASWSYPVAFAPPMAGELLGRAVPSLADVVSSLAGTEVLADVVLVESVGGVRSPICSDGDSVDLVGLLRPDLVVLVAEAGLGAINAVRLAADALGATPVVVHLNRYAQSDELHRRNKAWLEHDGYRVVADLAGLATSVSGASAPTSG